MGDPVIVVVDDEVCPRCGKGFPNRPKAGDENGEWWWRCYTEGCTVGYWLPRTGEVEERSAGEAPCCYGFVTSGGRDHEPDCLETKGARG